MRNFQSGIICIVDRTPYVQVDFDGIHLNKDLVKTILTDIHGVDHVNLNERGIDKHRAIVYPTTYCSSEAEMVELQKEINKTLSRL